MRRREFISFLGGATAWPIAAHAQQGGQMRRIGVLMAISADDAEAQARIAAFVQGLQQLGWTVGKDVRVDYRLAGIDADTLRKYATELVTVAPDVILVQSSSALAAMLQATRTIPIVFALIADPVGAGYVDSLAHPGGNATGFTVFEYSIGGKWLELLKEIAPHITRVAVLRELAVAAGPAQFSAAQTVAPSLSMELRPVDARDADEIERAIKAFARGDMAQKVNGLTPTNKINRRALCYFV